MKKLDLGCVVESRAYHAVSGRQGGVEVVDSHTHHPLGEEKGAGDVEVVEGLAMALLYLLPVTLATCSISLTTSSMAASLGQGWLGSRGGSPAGFPCSPPGRP